MKKKVVVLGGGMGGLSAAFELATRGFAVEVYEKNEIFGGKARSFRVPGSGQGGRPDLPAEHGFRIFPSWYQHINDSMARTPYDGPGSKPDMTVADRLVEVDFLAYALNGQPPFEFVPGAPDTLHEWVVELVALFTHERLGVPRHDAEFFVRQLICFMGSGEKRRGKVHENTSWWDYLEAASRSPAYRKICATGMTRSLVAMRAEVSSTYTVALILSQMLFTILRGGKPNRILDGPTSDVWIDPWVRRMKELGVSFHGGATVTGVTFDNGRMTSAAIVRAGTTTAVAADYFVCALPVEVTRSLLTPAQLGQAGLTRIANLETSWMNGVMCYAKRDLSLVRGHVIYLDSPWSVTSISQAQFWAPEFALANYGDGAARDILSAIVSDWDSDGNQIFHQSAKAAPDRDTITGEVWAQVKAGLAGAPQGGPQDADLLRAFLDPAIADVGSTATIRNAEPLLINTVGSIVDRPAAATAIANLAVAGDYIDTHTNLATMEGANEAGRRACNAILAAEGAPQDQFAGVWPLREPGFLALWRAMDDATFDPANPGDPPIAHVVDAILKLLGLFDAVVGPQSGKSAAHAAVEAMRRVSSCTGTAAP